MSAGIPAVRPPHMIVVAHPDGGAVAALLGNLAAALPLVDGVRSAVRLERRLEVAPDTTFHVDGTPRDERSERARGEFRVTEVGYLQIEPVPPRPTAWTDLAVDTANWIAVVVRRDRARTGQDSAAGEERAARRALVESEARIARVREIERHRLVRLLTDATLPRFARVRALLEVDEDPDWRALQAAMDDLIERLRSAVRGVFPAMLPDRGVAATLMELAATLPGHVRLRGDLGHRTGWEVETGFYLAVQAVLTAMSDATVGANVQVRLTRTDDLVADIESTSPEEGPRRLGRALQIDAERIHALGGSLVVAPNVVAGAPASGARASVHLPVHARIPSGVLSPAELDRCAMYRRVSEALSNSGLEETVAHELRAQLTDRARLLVVQMPGPANVPGVTVLTVEAAPDRELARAVLDPDGPWGRIDAVLCGLPPSPEFRELLRDGPLVFHERISQVQALGFLRMRAPVIAAKRVVERLQAIAATSGGTRLPRIVDRLAAGGQELLELRLVDALVSGRGPRVLGIDAARIIGSCGEDPRTRLGLGPDAPARVVRETAEVALQRWSAVASSVWFDRPSREAVEIVMRRAAALKLVGTVDELDAETVLS